jgi:co-chaperonin GroES (HSP10)
MPAMVMFHEKDPREVALESIGDISDVEISGNQVLIVTYERPEKTKSGLLLADVTKDEDRSQGKVGLIVKMGATAFVDPENKYGFPPDMALHDWIFYRASEAWAVTVNGKHCRVLEDVNLRGRVSHPDVVW